MSNNLLQLGNFTEARALSELAARDDPYSCAARVTAALSNAAGGDAPTWHGAAQQLAAASHLDPADLVAMHDLGMFIYNNRRSAST